VETTRNHHVERNYSMAEITRRGPLAGVRLIDFATVVMGPYASTLPLGELSEDPQVQEHLIEPAEKTGGSYSYAELGQERDHKHLAVLTALAGVNHHDNNENKGITYA
jgi:hypothetical protein